jgi:hypothetical protein
MDSLNKYKTAWQNQNIENQIDSKSLNKMIYKSSSSIVKWIFYVSLMEFTLIILMNVFIKTDWDFYKKYGLYHFILIVSVLGYLIAILFIILFYKNYKNISANQSTKELMQRILKTRKTVKYYVATTIISLMIAMFYSFWVILHSEDYEYIMDGLGENGHLVVWAFVIFSILFLAALLFGFYALIYGLLIKRLNKNYKELIEDTMN